MLPWIGLVQNLFCNEDQKGDVWIFPCIGPFIGCTGPMWKPVMCVNERNCMRIWRILALQLQVAANLSR